MFRLTVLLLLLVSLVMFVGIATALTPDGPNIDLDDIVVNLPQMTFLSEALAAAILLRGKNQIVLSRQIVLDFFFYGWRNTVYRRWTARNENIIKPGTLRCSRLFCWS